MAYEKELEIGAKIAREAGKLALQIREGTEIREGKLTVSVESKAGPDGWVSCAYLSGGRVDVMPRFHRHPRMYDPYDRGPSVEFNFGFGGPSMHVRPRPMNPWWY